MHQTEVLPNAMEKEALHNKRLYFHNKNVHQPEVRITPQFYSRNQNVHQVEVFPNARENHSINPSPTF